MSDVPDSWVEVPIGTVARIVGGGTPPSKDPTNFAQPGQGIPWLTPADLSGYRKQTIERGARDLTEAGFSACGATLMPKGTVLFSSRAPIGYVAIAENEISTNQGFKSFILPPGIDSRFTYYQLKWLKPKAEAIATGTTFKELSGAATATLPFKVAPAAEQTRIANQLDTLLARIQSCNDRFDAIPALLKRFRQVVLMKAITGELTANWRRLNQQPSSLRPIALGEDIIEIPVGWHLKTVQDIIDPDRPLCYGVVQPGEEQSGGVPLIRVQDLSNGTILGDQLRTVAAHIDQDFRRSRVKGGDLLISVVGTIGRAAIVPEDMTANIARAIARLSCKEGVLNKWAYFWFIADPLQWHLLSSSREVARKTLNLGDLALISIPIPPAQEQIEIVQRVDALFALADRIEAQANAARNHTQRLGPLVLAKAFRGELLPQDPQDESAKVLLERIATQRALPAAKKQPSKSRQVRATRAPKEATTMSKSRQDDDVKGRPYLADHLRRLGSATTAEVLFKASELPLADFYKQLAWEVAQGHIADVGTTLEARHAAG